MQTQYRIRIQKGKPMTYTTTPPALQAHRLHGAPKRWLARLRAAGQLRRERRALIRLSDQHLSDIGVTRAEAEAEANRGLWDAPNHWKR